MKTEIAIVMSSLVVGGVPKVLANMLEYIDYDNYDVTLWLYGNIGALESQINKKVTIKRWVDPYTAQTKNISSIIIKYLKEKKPITALKKFWYRFLSRINIKNNNLNSYYYVLSLPFLDEHKYSCVIAYHGLEKDLLLGAFNRFIAKKYIAWIHVEPWKITELHNILYKRADKIFCVSSMNKQNFLSAFPGFDNKTEVFFNIQNIKDIKAKAEEQINTNMIQNHSILSVGRLVHQKGFDIIPEVMSMLLLNGYDAKWYIIGDGIYRETIEKKIKDYNVANNVILLGEKLNPYPYMKNCDVYVQPSRYEGYCTTTAEAKILCKPIITTNVAGASDQFISGKNGIIVDKFNSNLLYEAIAFLFDNPSVKKSFSMELKNESNENNEIQKLYDFLK